MKSENEALPDISTWMAYIIFWHTCIKWVWYPHVSTT